MVLQSAPRSAQVFGWAEPGDNITVTVHRTGGTVQRPAQQHTARAGNDSEWSVQLEPVAAGAAPYSISVRSAMLGDGVTLLDVLFGEVRQ